MFLAIVTASMHGGGNDRYVSDRDSRGEPSEATLQRWNQGSLHVHQLGIYNNVRSDVFKASVGIQVVL